MLFSTLVPGIYIWRWIEADADEEQGPYGAHPSCVEWRGLVGEAVEERGSMEHVGVVSVYCKNWLPTYITGLL